MIKTLCECCGREKVCAVLDGLYLCNDCVDKFKALFDIERLYKILRKK